MRDQAAAAILDSFVVISESAAAIFSQGIERTIAEKTIEILFLYARMTGKIFAFPVLKKGIIPLFFIHANTILCCQMHSWILFSFAGENPALRDGLPEEKKGILRNDGNL